ncbi:hypothetical protein GMJLKIPL_5637 [Methylobacterium isbiliense]|jgi:hypothetical protein|uniref:Uncharacterized protein n=2 Tax=Methylobacterium isbiliense TaxID=315478 RepID=A0ABQ4SPB8_9HYPH|nr:hypothetical protein GMJLKIPL_5637 [Methylobacterium isbiliense]
MFEMVRSSMTLFFQGRLFAEPGKVYRQTAIGAVATAVILVVIGKLGLSLAVAAAAAGFIGGALQPYLFKDLRYR